LEFASTYTSYEHGQGNFTQAKDILGSRILVCAVLMGMPLGVDPAMARRVKGLLSPTATSHVSPDGYEYVVFDSAQIIPCYVLHCDYGASVARKEYEQMLQTPSHLSNKAWIKQTRTARMVLDQDDEMLYPTAVKAKTAAMKAAAVKYFPYRFGAAMGTPFVIEEIGEFDDDEESLASIRPRGESRRRVRWEDIRVGVGLMSIRLCGRLRRR